MENNHLYVTEELRSKYNLPADAIFDGSVDIVSADSDSVKTLKIAHAISKLEIFGLGEVAYQKIAEILKSPFEIFRIHESHDSILRESIGKSKFETFKNGILSLKQSGLPIETIIDFLMIDGLGETTRKQLGNYYSGIPYDFSGLEQSVVEMATNEITSDRISLITCDLEHKYDIDVVYNVEVKQSGLKYILTGKPNDFGYSKKSDFIDQKLKGFIEVKNMKDADLLVTDDIESKSSKMKQAEKYGVKIVTYGDLMFG